jgi:hypothetical protein
MHLSEGKRSRASRDEPTPNPSRGPGMSGRRLGRGKHNEGGVWRGISGAEAEGGSVPRPSSDRRSGEPRTKRGRAVTLGRWPRPSSNGPADKAALSHKEVVCRPSHLSCPHLTLLSVTFLPPHNLTPWPPLHSSPRHESPTMVCAVPAGGPGATRLGTVRSRARLHASPLTSRTRLRTRANASPPPPHPRTAATRAAATSGAPADAAASSSRSPIRAPKSLWRRPPTPPPAAARTALAAHTPDPSDESGSEPDGLATPIPAPVAEA